jgi:hypothetical protein
MNLYVIFLLPVLFVLQSEKKTWYVDTLYMCDLFGLAYANFLTCMM